MPASLRRGLPVLAVVASSLVAAASAAAAVPGSTLWASVPSGFGPFPSQDVNDSGQYNPMDRPGHVGASANGRYVVFSSQADGLSGEDDNRVTNVFVRDRTAGTTTLVSRAAGAAGAPANGNSDDPTISDDGRYVAFSSDATNLSPQDTNTFSDIYVRDLQTGAVTLISAVGGGSPVAADGGSLEPAISGDGSAVVFMTTATNLDAVAGEDTAPDEDIYRRTVSGTQPALVSRAGPGPGAKGNAGSYQAAISDDGQKVAFASSATNLDGADLAPDTSVFVRDVGAGTTKLVSRAPTLGGASANSYAEAPTMSGNGDVIAFVSGATNLDPVNDGVGGNDVYVRQVSTGTTTLASRVNGPAGAALMDAATPALSDDGTRVAFATGATVVAGADSSPLVQRTLTTGATTVLSSGPSGSAGVAALRSSYVGSSTAVVFAAGGGAPLTADSDGLVINVFLREPPAQPELVSRPTGNAPVRLAIGGSYAGGDNAYRQMSADGRYVVFYTRSPALSGVSTDRLLVVRRDLLTGEVVLISRADGASGAVADRSSYEPTISADGNRVAFVSAADNLAAPDTDTDADVFVRDVAAGTTKLVSRADGATGNAGDSASFGAAIAGGGRAVVFASQSANLVSGDSNGASDVFVRDLDAGTTTLASRPNGGGIANNGGSGGDISADGRRVAFASGSSNLGDGDLDTSSDIHLRDLDAGTTTLVSRADGPGGAKAVAYEPVISADGRVVAFESTSTSLGLPPASPQQVFVRDIAAATTRLVSATATGAPANGGSGPGGMNDDGSLVTFTSSAANLGVPSTSYQQVFLRRMSSPGAELISRADGTGGAAASVGANGASISGDGTCAMYGAQGAPTPLAGISPDFNQVYVRVLSRECPKDPPETSITSGPTGKVASADVAFGFASDEAGSTFECRVGGGAFAACSAPLQRSKLPDGPFSFEVRATDPAGITDPTPASRTVTIAVPPVIRAFTLRPANFRVGADPTATAAAKARRTGGTTLALRVSEPGSVRIALARSLPGRRVGKSCRKPSRALRRRKACVRAVPAGSLARKLKGTSLTLRFSGRVGRRALPAGAYTATATAKDAAGNVSAPRVRAFTVRR